MREKIKDLALQESELSPRELAVQFTDTEKYFVSKTSVYRILKSYDLTTSPAYVMVSRRTSWRALLRRSFGIVQQPPAAERGSGQRQGSG